MDPTVVAIPGYFGTMGAEHVVPAPPAPIARARPRRLRAAGHRHQPGHGRGQPACALLVPKLVGPITPGKGRYGKALVATALGAVAVTTIADLVVRRRPEPNDEPATTPGCAVELGLEATVDARRGQHRRARADDALPKVHRCAWRSRWPRSAAWSRW